MPRYLAITFSTTVSTSDSVPTFRAEDARSERDPWVEPVAFSTVT
ncbi:MAG: hypothetical protein AB7H80_06620 [Candidatus Kapaibacterium sp.]